MSANAVSMPSTATSRPFQRWELFTILMLIVMDLSWIAPAYALLARGSIVDSAGRIFLVLGAIYLASSVVASIPRYVDIYVGVIQIALLALLLLGALWAANLLIYAGESIPLNSTLSRFLRELITFSIPIKPELILSLVVFLIWRRGFSLANRSIGLGLIRRSFRTGGVTLVIVGVFAALFRADLPYVQSGLFILTCLLAMGGARLATLGSMRGSKPVAFKRQWVIGLIGMAVLVLVISASFGVFAAGPLASWAGGSLMALERALSAILKAILAPLIDFMGIIFTWFLGWFEPQPEQDPTAVDALEEGLEGPVARIQELSTDPEIAALLSRLGTVIGILIIVGILFYALRRFRQQSKPRAMGDGDVISSSGSLSDYLRGLGDRARQVFAGAAGLGPAARIIAAARIRIIYTRLLRLGARLGEPRAPAVTPVEYLTDLEKIFPASHDELELITNAYLRVRYGELPETKADVEAVESAWRVVRGRGRPV